MAEQKVHILVSLLLGGIAWTTLGPLAAYAIALGNMFPDIDDLVPQIHRSWITHSAFVPALVSYFLAVSPIPILAELLPFFTLGIVVHVVFDFVDYKEFKGLRMPFRPFLLGEKAPTWATMIIMLLPQIPFLLYTLPL